MRLGFQTEDLDVEMRRDATFTAVIRRRTSETDATPRDWDDGTGIELRFGTTVWPATISGSDAGWDVSATDVNTLLDSEERRASLFYVVGEIEVCWAVGAVITRTQPGGLA